MVRVPPSRDPDFIQRVIPDTGQCHYIGDDHQYCSVAVDKCQTYCPEHKAVIYSRGKK